MVNQVLQQISSKSWRLTTILNKIFGENAWDYHTKPIEFINSERQFNWLGHQHITEWRRLTKEVLEAWVYEKNKIGRPPLEWQDQVTQEAEKREIQWSNAKWLTQDRNFCNNYIVIYHFHNLIANLYNPKPVHGI